MSRYSSGLVSLVGAGPGDPGLLTLKGQMRLLQADIVLYGPLVPKTLLEVCHTACEVVAEGTVGGGAQQAIYDFLVHHGLRDKRVVRLKVGDPFLFGAGTGEIEALSSAGVPFEVVPGVTSGIASPAYSGIPLMTSERSSRVSFVECDDGADFEAQLKGLGRNTGTLVAFVADGQLSAVVNRLIQEGLAPNTPCAMILHGTTPMQQTITSDLSRVVHTAENREIRGPMVVVFGMSVSLRSQLAWFDRRPLWERRVLVTRARHQSESLVEALREAGAGVIRLPVLSFEPPTDLAPLEHAIQSLVAGSYDWVVFTSANAVVRFDQAIRRAGFDSRIYSTCQVACVGPATEAALSNTGIRADLVPQEHRGEGLLRALQRGANLSGVRFLLPRAEYARSALPDGLVAAGAVVALAPTYRTIQPDVSVDIAKKHVSLSDTVTFTSPSSVKNLLQILGDEGPTLLKSRTLAAIGPITSRALLRAGLEPTIVARNYTVDGLVEAIIRHAKNQ